MVRCGWLLLTIVAASQDDAGRDVRDLVARLRADRVEEREEAERALCGIGPAALPALKAAARDPDADFSRRAARLARIIEVVRLLGPRALEKIPGAEDLIGSENDRAWTDLFLKAHAMAGAAPGALDVLAARALAGAAPRDPESEGADERRLVARIIAERELRSAVPGLLSMLSSPDAEAREVAALALGHLRVAEALPRLRDLLKDPVGTCRAAAVTALGSLGTPEVIPDLALAVTDSSPRVSGWAGEALLHVAPAPAIAELTRLLDQKDLQCRGKLAIVLSSLRNRDDGWEQSLFSADEIADVDRSAIEVLTQAVRPALAPQLVPLLRHPQPAVRRSALKLLSRADARTMGAHVAPLLRDPDADVRLAAVETAGDLESASAADGLLDLLGDSDPRIQPRAAYSLCRLKCTKALPQLLGLLAQGNSETKRWVCWGLEDLLRPEDVPTLLRALEDPEESVRETVVRFLWKVAPVDAVPAIVRTLGDLPAHGWHPKPVDAAKRTEIVAALKKYFGDSEPAVRSGALRLAVKARLQEAIPEIRRLTEDPDLDLRSEAVQGLAGFLQRRAIPLIVTALDHDEDSIRSWACWKLSDLAAGEQAIPALLRFLDERGYERPVVDALVNLHAREAVPVLTKFLKTQAPVIRVHALNALTQLQAPPSAETIRDFLEDPTVRKGAVEAIAAQKITAAAPGLRAGLRTWDSDLRSAAIDALGVLGRADAGPDLVPYLDDDDSDIREAAARALGQLKERKAIPMLRRLLDDADPSVRQRAAHSLGEIGSKESVPDLLRLLRSEERMGRTAWGAVEALKLLDAREAVPDLIRLLQQEIRLANPAEATVSALRRLDPAAAGRAVLRMVEQEDLGRGPFVGALNQLQNTPVRRGCVVDLPSPPRVLAVDILLKLRTVEAVPLLRRLMADADEPLRHTAAVAFIQLAGPDRSAEIVELLRSPSFMVKVAALTRLSSLDDRRALAPALALLEDPMDDVRRAALPVCARLGGAEVLPRLRACLDDSDPGIRLDAASWLCRRGDRAGVPMILRDGLSLISLNALRSPEIWRRLAETPMTEPVEGTVRDLLAKVARRSGLALDIPADLPPAAAAELDERGTIPPDGKATLLDALLSPRYGTAGVLLDGGRLRLVLRAEEWKFWETWSEQAKR